MGYINDVNDKYNVNMIALFLINSIIIECSSLLINEGNFYFKLFKFNQSYNIIVREEGNITRYSYPIGRGLTYNGHDFSINNNKVNIISQIGNVTVPHLFRQILNKTNNISVEPFEVCYDFTTERISLKVAVGVLGILVFLCNISKISTLIVLLDDKTRKRDKTQPESLYETQI